MEESKLLSSDLLPHDSLFVDPKLKAEFFAAHDPALLEIWQKSTIGIAGAGGLGSNIAVSLCRAGIGRLIIADFDVINTTNLNRQQFFLDQVGKLKVNALASNLWRINPFCEVIIYPIRISEDNVKQIFGECDILLEAFDLADQKQMLIETWQDIFAERPIIGASGLAGYGRNEFIKVVRFDNVYLCGDGISELKEGISPIAPRVAIVANMQANLCLELLSNIHKTNTNKS